MKFNTLIIAGFPGIGKSFLKDKYGDDISDSDSSNFPKDKFPQNYIKHIQKLIGNKKIILVSTHKEVLEGLENKNISYILCYPKYNLKQEYLERYKQRESPPQFISLLDEKWDEFFSDLEDAKPIHRLILKKGEFLNDRLEALLK